MSSYKCRSTFWFVILLQAILYFSQTQRRPNNGLYLCPNFCLKNECCLLVYVLSKMIDISPFYVLLIACFGFLPWTSLFACSVTYIMDSSDLPLSMPPVDQYERLIPFPTYFSNRSRKRAHQFDSNHFKHKFTSIYLYLGQVWVLNSLGDGQFQMNKNSYFR